MRSITLKHFLIIFLIVLSVYANTLGNDLLRFDDYENVVSSTLIRDLGESARSLSSKNIAFAVIYNFFGANSIAFHAHSVVLHLLNTLLVYLVAFEFFKGKRTYALYVALIFAVNPITGETVNWVTGSVYLHFAFLALLVFYFFLKYRNEKEVKWLFLSALFYGVLIVTQRTPWALTIPFILAGLNIGYVVPKKFYAVVGIISLVYATMVLPGQYGARIVDLESEKITSNSPGRIVSVGRNISYAFMSLVFPFNVSVVHNPTSTDFTITLLYLFSFALLFSVLKIAYKRDIVVFSLLFLYFVSVLPIFSPIKVAINYTERYFYIATVFASILYIYLLDKLVKDKKRSLLIFTLILVIFSVRSFIRTFDWRTNYSLWNHARAVAPKNYKPYMELGIEAHKSNLLRDALGYYDQALKLNTQDPLLMYNIGLTYLKSGRLDIAEAFFANAIKINENFSEAYYRLGQLSYLKEDYETALGFYTHALEINPEFSAVLEEIAKIKGD